MDRVRERLGHGEAEGSSRVGHARNGHLDKARVLGLDDSVLTCAECGPQSDGQARGWEAHLGADDIDEIPEDEEPRRLLAFVFCRECA
jgi:hypothetical protein